MKLMIILLCVASERYLVHSFAAYRQRGFQLYFNKIKNHILSSERATNPYLMLAVLLLPVILIGLLLYALDHTFYGIFSFILTLAIFYLCLGPQNPFYPLSTNYEADRVANYYIDANHQLFSVIFWFIVGGPVVVLLYRLLYLSKEQSATTSAATVPYNLMDWISARVTVLLYLLVGNFQQGFQYYTKVFFSSPAMNDDIIRQGGTLAAAESTADSSLPEAQTLVEHALVLFLVVLAAFTLVAWL